MYKKVTLRNLVASLMLGACVLLTSSTARGAERTTRFSRPAKVRLDRLIKKRFGEYYKGAEWNHLLIEQFYPIGWSRDGKIAYLVEPADEACDCYFAMIAVQDLITDKVLWEVKYQEDREEDGKQKESLITYWRANQAAFSKKLAEYKIEPLRPFVLLPPKITFGKDSIVPELKIKRDPQSVGFGQITNVTLHAVSNQRGRKLIFELKIPLDEYSGLLDAQVVGHLRSPFEPLAAFVVIEVQRGWEGPPHTTNVRIVGAKLASGFGR